LVASDGGIFSFGDAAYYGSEPGDGTNVDNSVGIEASSSGDGYWVAGADGRVGTFGDATPEGSMLGLGLNKPIVAFASIPAELAAPSLSITNLTMPNATTGSPYSASLDAIGGTSPYSWSVESGSLPPGLSLSTTGTITGTPSTQGSSTFSVKVTDSTTPTLQVAYADLSIEVFETPIPTGQATSLATGRLRGPLGPSAFPTSSPARQKAMKWRSGSGLAESEAARSSYRRAYRRRPIPTLPAGSLSFLGGRCTRLNRLR
jgi:hypothetical protein